MRTLQQAELLQDFCQRALQLQDASGHGFAKVASREELLSGCRCFLFSKFC